MVRMQVWFFVQNFLWMLYDDLDLTRSWNVVQCGNVKASDEVMNLSKFFMYTIWCLYLSLPLDSVGFFSTFCHGGLSHASAMLSDGHEHSLTYKLMIILRKFDQDAIFGCWIHVHDEFNFESVYPNFLILNRLTVWLWIQLIQRIDLLFWGGKWDHPKIPIWVDPPCSLAIGWNFIQRRGLRKQQKYTTIRHKISAAMQAHHVSSISFAVFLGKKKWKNFTFRRWIICGPTSRSATTATSKTATWSSGSYGRAHRWCWRTPVIWRFLIWNRRCIHCSRCRGWDGIVVWFVEICCLGCL